MDTALRRARVGARPSAWGPLHGAAITALVVIALAYPPSVTGAASPPSTIPPATPSPTPSPGGLVSGTPIVAFSDPSALDQAAWDAQLPKLQTRCRPVGPGDQPTFDDAMAGVRSWLDSATGGGLSTLEASSEYADEATASAVAAELAAGGMFAAALALELQAHRAEPDDARHLVNAAGLLVVLDRPAEALAFLDRTTTMAPPDATPMGIDQTAVALTNRGLALSSQGRYAEAADALRTALALDPNLTEAADDLASVQVCLGKGSAAFALVSEPRRDQLSRLPEGRRGTLPDLKLPATPADAVPMSDVYQGLVDDSIVRLLGRMDRRSALLADGGTRASSPASATRVASIQSLMGRVEALPEFRAWFEELAARGLETDRITNEMWGTSGAMEQKSTECANTDDYNGCIRAWCIPETRKRHAQWRGAFDGYETVLRDAYAVIHERSSALVGLVEDPVTSELLALDLQDLADRWFYGMLVPPAQQWTRLTTVNASSCIEETAAEPVVPIEGPEVVVVPCDPGTFPQGLMPAVRFRDIPIGGQKASLKISARCEEITLEASGPAVDRLGLLKPFAQIKGTGKGLTIFAGVKGGLELEPGSLNAKVGPYVTVDYEGNVMDYGVRVAPGSANVETGPFGIRVWEAQAMDFSFVGISDYMPLIGTQ